MFLKCLSTGILESNCYILGNLGEAVIIDAGVDEYEILDILVENSLKLKYIILTHGHYDHISSIDKLRKETGAKVLIHEGDANYLVDPMLNGSGLYGKKDTYSPADKLLRHGDVITSGGMDLNIIHTPGHSLGGICINIDNKLFTGDTLFKLSIGRTDLVNGDFKLIMASIVNNLLILPEDTIVYPGHGDESTIGFEKKNNYFLKN